MSRAGAPRAMASATGAAAVILLACAGTKVIVVDRDLTLAERPVTMIATNGPPQSPMPPIRPTRSRRRTHRAQSPVLSTLVERRATAKTLSLFSASAVTLPRQIAKAVSGPSANTLVLSATSQIVTHLEAMAHNIAIASGHVGSGEARGQVSCLSLSPGP